MISDLLTTITINKLILKNPTWILGRGICLLAVTVLFSTPSADMQTGR